MRWAFDECVLDPERRELQRSGVLVALEPQVFDLLVYLIRNCERVVSKDDLFQAVWRGRIVSDSALANRINAARVAVGDSGDQQALIRTLPRKGFRFVGTITEEREPLHFRSCRSAGPALAGRAAVRGPERGPARQSLRRWHHRGPDHRAGAKSLVVRHRAKFRIHLPETAC